MFLVYLKYKPRKASINFFFVSFLLQKYKFENKVSLKISNYSTKEKIIKKNKNSICKYFLL